MNKTTIISILGILTLFLSQIYWLHNIYENHIHKIENTINDLFSLSIDIEMGNRWNGNKPLQNPGNPKWVVKSADDMTPEERANLKGDTIKFNKTEEITGESLPAIFSQRIQDEFIKEQPLQLQVLDSIFNSQLAKSDIHTSFQINLFNKDTIIVDTSNKSFNKKIKHITTALNPIGTQGLLFTQAYIEVPTSAIWRNMLASLIVSILIVAIVFGCLYYQLTVLRKTKQQLKLREETVHSAIHDLKAPMNTTYTILDIISLNEKNGAQLHLLEEGKIRIRQLSEIIESMLGITKRARIVSINKTEVNVIELIEQVEKGLSILYPNKQYTFNLKNNSPHTFIYTDKVRLERCFRNLMENALKYSDNDVNITVSLSEHDKQFHIAISDNGWGIPRQALKKLGTQFYRVNPIGKETKPGYGIGLSSVKHLLKEMEGKLTFQSIEGKGSTFFIILPTE